MSHLNGTAPALPLHRHSHISPPSGRRWLIADASHVIAPGSIPRLLAEQLG